MNRHHVSFMFLPDNDAVHGWTLLVPLGATSVKIPALPASAAGTPAGVTPLGTQVGDGFTVRHTMLPSVGMTLRGTEP